MCGVQNVPSKLDYRAINLAEFTVLGTFCTDGFNVFSVFSIFFRLNQRQKVEQTEQKIDLF